MVNLGKVHVGDVGTNFQLLVEDTDVSDTNSPVDLSTTTLQEIIFTDPDGIEKSAVTASITNPPGSDGIIEFVTLVSTFIDKAGEWFYRARLTFSGGNVFSSNDARFEVLGSAE